MNTLDLVRLALEEDRADSDCTTQQCLKLLGNDPDYHFVIVAKDGGVFSGSAWTDAFAEVTGLKLKNLMAEGAIFAPSEILLEGAGKASVILSSERTLLNELQHLCGIATATRAYVDRVGKNGPGVYHIRKTMPLHRALQVQAVLAGGGKAHRMDLSQRPLFKENHKYLLAQGGLQFEEWVATVVKIDPLAMIEVETGTEALQAVNAGARALLCDNFSVGDLKNLLPQLQRRDVEIEVSGGLRLETIADFALPGVARLSVGALTHQVRSIDLSLDWKWQ